jgi:uncharacterized protein (TIGR00251 family)
VSPTDPAWVTDRPDGALIRVRIKPRASRDKIEAVTPDGLLSVRLCAPPVENQANSALVELLAKSLRLPKSSLAIASGDKSRVKNVSVTGLSAAEVRERLLPPEKESKK